MMVLSLPENYRPYLKMGTCSWKYDSWNGLVYPEEGLVINEDYLDYYSTVFQTVEVDQWFWSLFPGGLKLPDSNEAEYYASRVPDTFEFTVKVPNSLTLTHYYAKQSPRYKEFANKENDHFLSPELLEKFLDQIGPLKSKLGALMFQFEYLNKKKMNSQKEFLEKLGTFFTAIPKDLPYAVEIRNPNYLNKAYFALLRSHNVAAVLVEGYYMPPIDKVYHQYDTVTADFSIIRLMGPDRAKIEKQTNKVWNTIAAPQDTSIATTADIIDSLIERKVKTYVNVNNHYEGSAPLTINRLIECLTTKPDF